MNPLDAPMRGERRSKVACTLYGWMRVAVACVGTLLLAGEAMADDIFMRAVSTTPVRLAQASQERLSPTGELLSPNAQLPAPQTDNSIGIAVPAAASVERQQTEQPTIVNAGLPVARQQDLRCDVPFDNLPEARTAAGRLNRPFNPHEFREVTWLSTRSIVEPRVVGENCSGTLIGDRWILTAAHCFFFEQSAGGNRQHLAASEAPNRPDVQRSPDRIEWRNDVRSRIQAQFLPELPGAQLDLVLSSRVIVHGQYGGRRGGFENDLALVELIDPVRLSLNIQPARLPARTEMSEFITIAGYGISNAPGHRLGILEVGWPPRLSRHFDAPDLTYDFAADGQAPSASGFCPGDSGGPAFLGRHRGCTSAEESRPRPITGVISTLRGAVQPSLNDTAADRCLRSPQQRLVSVIAPAARDWICRHTADAGGRPTVQGC